jgi:hypothetical protein
MEINEIPQIQYLIDGIPACKYGEWPGISSNKWKGSIKILKPADQLHFDCNFRLFYF